MGALLRWQFACLLALAAAGALVTALVMGLGTPKGLSRGTRVLTGRVVFPESRNSGFEEVAPGQGVVRVVWKNDVVETVDLAGANAYVFRLWPGRYTLRAGLEHPRGEDDVCIKRIKIRAEMARRVIFRCTPSEKLRTEANAAAAQAVPARTILRHL